MRIAACLSGHSRNYKDNIPNFPFEVEYFVSSCMESGLPNQNTPTYISYHSQNDIKTNLTDINDVINQYNPKSWEFLPDGDIPTEVNKFVGLKTNGGAYLHHIAMMFYRIYRANLLKCEHEREYNFTYDFVIRSRFDVKVNQFNFNQEYLYLVKKDDKVLDLFFAGKSHVIDAISNCYLWMIKQKPAYLQSFFSGEHIFYHYVDQLKLNLPMLNNFTITFNKDYPIQHNIIKNGLTKAFERSNEVFIDELNV